MKLLSIVLLIGVVLASGCSPSSPAQTVTNTSTNIATITSQIQPQTKIEDNRPKATPAYYSLMGVVDIFNSDTWYGINVTFTKGGETYSEIRELPEGFPANNASPLSFFGEDFSPPLDFHQWSTFYTDPDGVWTIEVNARLSRASPFVPVKITSFPAHFSVSPRNQ